MQVKRLASGDADGADAGSSGPVQDAGALVERGPGGQHVIDENEVFVFHGGIVAHMKGVVQVFHTLGAVEGGLGFGAANSLQALQDREMVVRRQ